MSVAGVVLAAGRSERMGAPKALLDFRGRPFVIRILEALEALDLKPRVVVLGPDAPRIRPALAAHECLIVENLDVAGGPIGSLRAALAALDRKSTRLNSSHGYISYAVFCLKKKKSKTTIRGVENRETRT